MGLVRKESRNWWNIRRQKGEIIRWAHPDELAEHIIFSIRDYFRDSTLPLDRDPNVLAIQEAIFQGRFEDAINFGESKYRVSNPNTKISLVGLIFDRLA